MERKPRQVGAKSTNVGYLLAVPLRDACLFLV